VTRTAAQAGVGRVLALTNPALFPVGEEAPRTVQVLDLLVVLVWLAAIVIAVWGSIHDARQVEREERADLWENPEPGPTPGVEGFLNRWAIWALGLVLAGLLLLALATQVARSG
jgi:hypothetical protein